MPKRICHAAKKALLDVFREFDGVVFAHFVIVRLALHGDAFVGSQFLLDFREQFGFESGILLDSFLGLFTALGDLDVVHGEP